MRRSSPIAIRDHGGDGKVIILLHGFLASSKYWARLQPHLSAAGYRVITIDLLGFGKAPKPPDSEYTYDEHVAHIHASIKSLHIPTPFALVGHSMGALLAVRYSHLHKGYVNALVLLHPPLYKDMAEAHATLRQTSKLYRFLLDSCYRQIGWVLVKTFARYHIGRHTRTAREKSLRNVIEKAEAFDDLRTITTKTMLVVGTKDRVEYSRNLALHTISRSIEVAVEDVTHHSPAREPLLILERIRRFV